MRDAWLELDDTLKQRVRVVLDDPERLVTEAELRKLSEEGRGMSRILGAELQRLEQHLAELDSDPASPFGAIGPAFRRVHDFREHLAELDGLLTELEDRARQVRTSRLMESALRPLD
ncbi:MAG TPA: hypothetical protein VNB86_10265 [Gaiellaceae bacterium]|jgi:hypothetical protein|nr:hypothetical protein [Gaiellaceae bacterium]